MHILYGWHPLHLAKFAASIDHMSHGRWGLNVVTGYKKSEYEMFGLSPIEHDLRYEMADEFSRVHAARSGPRTRTSPSRAGGGG